MTQIRHHIGEDLLIEYAAGTLSEGWSLAVACHLAMCPQCRQQLALAEATAGAMLEELQPADGPSGSWDALKARLDAEPEPKAKPIARPASATLPEPLRSYLGGDVESLKWRNLGNARQILIETDDETTQTRLLCIAAGKPVPEHSHGGRELTLVLTGSFHDELDSFGPGDVEDADGSVTHQPIAGPEADCICLAVTDAPLKFSSRLVRLIQPILGI
ncbi:ChrR family anti-sigma-E factor [Devosia sediminis]|uniref:Cupin domain-containing protein n=1 Tax=Devosia sediminis TaxID=2798801 RepID=A0A934J0A2_9HYPH|nr:ChrR family anti-sigma-E factor [Devosia sediminis]MBJ3785938.1 cupin domain-containing protein [Devosia sediminis]